MKHNLDTIRASYYECSRETDGGDEELNGEELICPKCEKSDMVEILPTNTPAGHEEYCSRCEIKFLL